MLARTVIVSLLIGVVVTLVAALAPALRATRITPMAALRESELQDSQAARAPDAHRRARCSAGSGWRCMLIGLFGGIEESGTAAGLLGGGAALILFATSLFSPRLVRPLASLAGKPMERVRGLTGRLARENAMRKPGRTATTAAALMIGLALVTFVTVFAAGLKSSIAKTIDENFKSDVILQNTDGFSPIPGDAVAAAREVDGVASVSALTYGSGEYQGEQIRVAGIDPETINGVLSLDFVEGSPAVLRGLTDREAVADEAWADSKGLDGGRHRQGPYAARENGDLHDSRRGRGRASTCSARCSSATRRSSRCSAPTSRASPSCGSSTERPPPRSRATWRRRSGAGIPTVEVQNQEQLKDNQESQVNALLLLVYALLSLAVIVSLFGIVNTLALSIHERTRELGMLRAVGMSRRQVRTMVRYEAVITALIGAILGMVLGVLMAALVSRPLADEGFTLSYPIATLILLLVLAALAGVVAAIGPARRASRIDVLRALAYE